MGYETDKRWSDRFLPEIKSILGGVLLTEGSFEEDAKRNSDLLVLHMQAVRIGCRVRRYPYFLKYPNDFTIRTVRKSGNMTELAKVLSGWGDYFFYGFSDEKEERLIYWLVGDFKIFRLWHSMELGKCVPGNGPGREKKNSDGSSDFRAYNKNIVLKSGPFIIAEKCESKSA